MLPYNTGDCFIEVTAWACLTVSFCIMLYTKKKQPINYNYRRISFHNNEAVLTGINQQFQKCQTFCVCHFQV
jgi:hypothetical protein